jgi:hypothetical protein
VNDSCNRHYHAAILMSPPSLAADRASLSLAATLVRLELAWLGLKICPKIGELIGSE